MRLRRFSQLGWHTCQDLAGFVMGDKVERVELGPPPVLPPPRVVSADGVLIGNEWVASSLDGNE